MQNKRRYQHAQFILNETPNIFVSDLSKILPACVHVFGEVWAAKCGCILGCCFEFLIIISANYKLIAMLTDCFLAQTSIAKSSWTCNCLWWFVSLRGTWKAVAWALVRVTRSAAVMFKKPEISLWSQWHSQTLIYSAVNCRCHWLKWVWLANWTLKSVI